MEYKDYTVKAILQDFDSVKIQLGAMGAGYIGLDRQVDTYFETTMGKLKLRQGTIENLITHYERVIEASAERTVVYRYDKDPSPEEILQLRASHKQLAIVQKDREIYTVGNIKIHLDTLPNQQRFIEIEAIDLTNAFTQDELKNQCLAMKSKLGIQDGDLVKTGYLAV